MKLTDLLIAPILISGSIVVNSCGSNTQPSGSETSDEINNFEFRQTIKTISRDYLCEGEDAIFADSLKIYSNVRLSVAWPEKIGDKDISVLRDSLVKSVFSDSVASSIDKAMVTAASHPEGEDSFTMVPVDSIPSDKPAMVYTSMKSLSVMNFNPCYIVYEISSYIYSGGAHGMTESHYINYDINSAEVLTFDNIFIPNYEDKLLDAIKTSLIEQFCVPSLSGLQERGIFTDQLFVTHNIYLDKYDIVFHYNPYDIGAYALGSINARVPYFNVEALLTPQAKRLLSTPIYL